MHTNTHTSNLHWLEKSWVTCASASGTFRLWLYKPLGCPNPLDIHVRSTACGNTPVPTHLHWDQLALKFQSCSPAVWTQCTLEGYSLKTATDTDGNVERDKFIDTHTAERNTHTYTTSPLSLTRCISGYTSRLLHVFHVKKYTFTHTHIWYLAFVTVHVGWHKKRTQTNRWEWWGEGNDKSDSLSLKCLGF